MYKRVLKHFVLENTKTYSTPMSTSIKLDKDKHGENVDQKKYQGGLVDYFIWLLIDQIFYWMLGCAHIFYLTANKPDMTSHLATRLPFSRQLFSTFNKEPAFPKLYFLKFRLLKMPIEPILSATLKTLNEDTELAQKSDPWKPVRRQSGEKEDQVSFDYIFFFKFFLTILKSG